MDMAQLQALGFHCVGGKIDRLGKNYGYMSKNGPVLTPEGQAIVANTLSGDDLVVAVPEKTKSRSTRRPTAADAEFVLED